LTITYSLCYTVNTVKETNFTSKKKYFNILGGKVHMSFADIINQESKNLENNNGGDNAKVKYPETKHKRLFFAKNERELLIQVLPSANLVSAFAVPVRKIFLSAKSSQGKDINSNFTLDAEANPGSILEQKIAEWSGKGMIPNGFGGQQSPKRAFLVNVVKIVQNPANPQQWLQERDEHGNLVVRVFEMPQSGYANLIRKLQDPFMNNSGTELSFLDPNKPAPIKISKPAKGQMEYPVDVYTNFPLPALGQGWENQLEDLQAQAVPTERLENGLQWVQAFIDMKEGRKPTRNNEDGQAAQPQQPVNNPYAQQGQPQGNPFAQQGQPQQPVGNPFAQPQQPVQPNPFEAAQPQSNPFAQPQQPTGNPFAQPQGLQQDQLPDSMGGIDTALNNLPQAPTEPTQPVQPQQPVQPAQPTVPAQPQQNAVPQQPAQPTMPAHANGNGLMDIDAMLDAELGNN